MVATMMKGVLEPLGLYKVNEEYVAPLNTDLDEIDTGLQTTDGLAERGSRILDALREDDRVQAVAEVLEHLEIDDELEQLRAIKDKVAAGELLEAAVEAADAPKLLRELLDSSARVIAEAKAQLEELIASAESLARTAAAKALHIKDDSERWSFAEKLGTPEALQGVRDRADAAQASGQAAKEKLDLLRKSLDELRQARG